LGCGVKMDLRSRQAGGPGRKLGQLRQQGLELGVCLHADRLHGHAQQRVSG
jgi:hypothetical protein